MIDKSINLKARYLSQADGRAMVVLEIPEECKEQEWLRTFERCQAIFQPRSGKLVITCQNKPLKARKSWLQILEEGGGYFW